MPRILLPRLRYPAVLLSLVALIFGPSHLSAVFGEVGGGLAFELLFALLMLSALAPIAARRRTLATGIALSIPVILSNWMVAQDASRLWLLASYAVFTAFVGFNMLGALLRARTADTDTICAAICFYLLCALNFALVYVMIETAAPGSFNLGADAGTHTVMQTLLYFSFVTIATLGYGDVLPLSEVARSWASMESVVGQLYIAIVVARLVALQLSAQPHRARD